MGMYFIGDVAKLRIIEPLVTKPIMETVWRNLRRREMRFKQIVSLNGDRGQPGNLVGACVEAEMRWLNLPKWTKTEYKKLHEEIASLALQLCELTTKVHNSRDLLDVRKYITDEQYKRLLDGLEYDDHEIWYGFEGYLDDVLSRVLPPVPRILLELHKRALEKAKQPRAVSQPKAPSAKLNFFISEISGYFTKSYGQPLHAHVAAVVSALY